MGSSISCYLLEVKPIVQMELNGENRTDNSDGLHIVGHDIQSEAGTSHRTDDNKSTKVLDLNRGKSGTYSDLGKQAVLAFLQQMPDTCPSDGVEHPSLLKIQVPPSLQSIRKSMIDKIVEDSISDEQCYSILREMEVEEDNTFSLELHKEMEEPDSNLEQARVETDTHQMEEYDVDFPILSKANFLRQKWSPIQATRCSSRVEPSGNSILEKAQELKQVNDLETSKKGKKKHAFSLFNNRCFIEIAKKVGVEVEHADSSMLDSDPLDRLGNIKLVDSYLSIVYLRHLVELLRIILSLEKWTSAPLLLA